MKRIIYIALFILLLFSSCSTVKNLPEGEILYTGIKQMKVYNEDKSDEGEVALTEVEAALACAPNNSLFGSSQIRVPFPAGLWWYNSYVNSTTGMGKWLFKTFAAKPVLMSEVNPQLRSEVATNVLRNYGYFHGKVTSQIDSCRNPKKQKASYFITMNKPCYFDSISYLNFVPAADSLIRSTWKERLLLRGGQFTVTSLDAERTRLSTLFRNNGYYYFQSNYITYQADTLHRNGNADLHVEPLKGLSSKVMHPWYIGNINVLVRNENESGMKSTDTLKTSRLTYYYSGKKAPVRAGVLMRRISVRRKDLYSQESQTNSLTELSRMNIFSSMNFIYTPRDTTSTCDTLDLTIITQLDKPYSISLEMNVTSKSNSQVGPGVVASIERHNIFRGGETLKLSLNGSYEWQTNGDMKGRQAVVNSWEIGADVSLSFPRLFIPFFNAKRFRYPSSTSFHLYANQLNRSGFFKMVSVGGEASFILKNHSTTEHNIIPFRLTYDMLQRTTATFDSIVDKNKALAQSFKNQFIPAMQYTFTYDNTKTTHRNKTWWQMSVVESGNLVSLAYCALGKSWNDKNKEIVFNPYAQFVKLTSEVRQLYKINSRQYIATRFIAGVIKPYGNSSVAPYSEQFYVGGANGIRAFTIRSIGPGGYHPSEENKYSYLDETGNLKLEANLEYRFPLFGNLYGATFVDAGNVWLLKKDETHPDGQITMKDVWSQIALGTGAGLRYDLEFLVLRLDLGVPLHAPYDTGKTGYFNTVNYWKGLCLHFAIGYPF